MEDRFTVKLEPATERARLNALAEEVAAAFGLSQTEAETLLNADTLVLARQEARILAGLCRKLGIEVMLAAPPRHRARSPWLALLGLLAVLALGLTLALVWPNSSPEVLETADSASVDSRPGLIEPVAPGSRDLEPRDAGVRDAGIRDSGTRDGGVRDGAPSRVAESTSADSDDTDSTSADSNSADSNSVDSNSVDSENADIERAAIEPVAPSIPGQEPSPPELFAAARDGDAFAVRQALGAASQVDLRDPYGQTPLMYAAGENDASVVAVLLASGAQPNARSDAGWTPLMYAARNVAWPEAALRLLEAGADPALRSDSGQNAHDIALAYNNALVAAHLQAAPVPAPQAEPFGDESEEAQVVTPPDRIPAPAASPAVALTPLEPSPSAPETPQDEANRETIERCLQNWETCETD